MDVRAHAPSALALVGSFAVSGLVIAALAPAGTPVASTIAVVVSVGCGVVVVGFGASRLVARMPAARAMTSAVIIAAMVSMGLAVRAGLDLRTAQALSQTLIRPAPELGPGGKALLPNLNNAESVVPDRPHHPDDVNAVDRFDRFTRLRRFQASTNAQGLRGPNFASPAPGFRILCIGDSVTFGWGVADDETYPAHLGRTLNLEVLNAGMPASKPAHMAKWLQLNARSIDADLVILAARPHWAMPDPFADYQRAVQQAEAAIAPAKLAIVLPPVSTFDPMGVRDRQKEVEGLQRVLQGRPFLELTPVFWRAQSAPGVVMETDGNVQTMLRLPERTVVAQGTQSDGRLAPALVEAFEADHTLIEPLFFDGGHPDESGNALFANTVAQFLREQGLLPKGPERSSQQRP